MGQFELERVIGQGGMGRVYRAVHDRTGQPVAVKLLIDKRARGADFRRQFLQEVEVMARMNHPGIATILDIGIVGEPTDLSLRPFHGSPWIAMEFVDGAHMTPAASFGELKRLLTHILDALAHAHSLGVIHRDLKPANILLPPDDSPKLVDFGISLPTQDSNVESDERRILGTPRYMAPEQIIGSTRDQGPWTDLYALGCLAWWMSTGRTPFDGDMETMLRAHVHEPPPALEPLFDVPNGFEELLRCLLAKSPARRFRRAADCLYQLMSLDDANASVDVERAFNIDHDDTTIVVDLEASFSQHRARESSPTKGPSEALFTASAPPTPPFRADSDVSPQLEGSGLGLFDLRIVPIVDRIREREELWRRLRDVRESSVPVAMRLYGDVGSGKTRLVEWLARRAHACGAATVLSVSNSQIAGPNDGTAGMLARYFRCAGLDWKGCFERLTSQLEILGLPRTSIAFEAAAYATLMTNEPDHPSFESVAERHASLSRLFEALAGDRALILWVEDAHWGLETVRLIEHLLEQRQLPLLAVLSIREEEVGSDLVERLNRIGPRVDIGPLQAEDQLELLSRKILIEPDLAQSIVARTEGNPLFALQLVSDWISRESLVLTERGFGLDGDESAVLPDDIRTLWQTRLNAVLERSSAPNVARQSVELAAVLGREIRFDEWENSLGSAGLRAVYDLVPGLQRSGLARRTEVGWRFAHSMFHEYVLRHIAPERVAQLHSACAQGVEKTHSQPGPRVLVRIAEHLAGARQFDRAAGCFLDAARDSWRISENGEALALLERHSAMLDAGAKPAESQQRTHGRLLSLECRRDRGERSPGEARRIARVCERNGWTFEHAWARRLLGSYARDSGRLGEAESLYRHAIQLFEQLEELAEMGYTAASLATSLQIAGRMEDACATFQRAADLLAEAGDMVSHGRALQLLGAAHLAADDLERAHHALDAARKALDYRDSRARRAGWANLSGEIARFEGRFATACDEYRLAVELWTQSGSRDRWLATYNLAMTEALDRQTTSALKTLEECEAGFRDNGFDVFLPMVFAARLVCVAVEARFDQWDEAFGNLATALAARPLYDPDLAKLCVDAGEAAIEAGALERAAGVLELAALQWDELEAHDEAARAREQIAAINNA